MIAFDGWKLPENYLNMIYSKWMRSLRFGNDYFKLIDSDCYYHAYEKYINQILGHPDALITMAVLADDIDIVLGFCVSRGEILDYVHVHQDYRMKGIAKKLVPKTAKQFTHVTKTGLLIWNNKYPELIFNPFV